MNLSEFQKKISWQDIAFIFLVILFSIFFISHASEYKNLPSPVFGGDVYRDRGFVQNIVSGGKIWSDTFYVNELQYYGYLIPAIQAGIVKLFGFTVNKVFIFFPIILLISGLISWYVLGKIFFKDKTWALLCSIVFIGMIFEYAMKTGTYAYFTFIPLFFYFWIKYESDGKKIDAVLAGLILGILPLIYGGTFLALVLIVASYIIYSFVKKKISLYKKKELNMKSILNLTLQFLKKYWLFALVAIAFALIYFGPLIIKYHLHVVNDVPKWGDPKVELLGLGWMFDNLRYFFFFIKSIPYFLLSITSLIGFISLFITKKTVEKKILLFALIANIITVQHQVITYPLFGVYFWSVKLFIMPYLMPLVLVFGVKIIAHTVTKNFKNKNADSTSENKENESEENEISLKNINPKIVVFVVFTLLLMLVFVSRFDEFKSSQWIQAGMQDSPYMNSLYTLSKYIEKNVKPDETIFSNDESGFMLAVLSGRKVVLTRRTHASYYVDIDQRIADAAVALYGNDINKSKEILKKYNAKYLYIDQNLAQYPMRTDPKYADYLTKYGVKFTKAHDRYDIALSLEQATLLDVLIIEPQNATAFISLFEPEYYATVDGQQIAQLLKLRE